MNRLKTIVFAIAIISITTYAGLSCGFIIDLSPPFVLPDGLYPPPDTTISETDITIDISLDDPGAGVWLDSVRMVVDVNGLSYDSIVGSTSFFVSFTPGDTVKVCVTAPDEIFDTLWCTCPANVLDTCWTFYILACDTLMSEHICPDPCDIITSCSDQEIKIRLYPQGFPLDIGDFIIDDIMAVVKQSSAVTETLYSAPRLGLLGDTVIVYQPFSGYSNGDTVQVSILSRNACPAIIADSCSFVVDLEPPYLTGFYPPADTTIGLATPSIIANLTDDIAGVLAESTWVRSIANHTDGSADTLIWLGPGPYSGDYQSQDTVEICVTAIDAIDYFPGCTCPPNVMDTVCWEFTVFYCVAGPFAQVVYPDSCGPYVTSCADQGVNWTVFDTTGLDIDSTSILVQVSVRGPSGPLDTTITPSSLTLSWDGISNLYFNPGLDGWNWASGDTVIISLVAAPNTGGCPLEAPAECSFIVDLDPPVVIDFLPTEGEILPSTSVLVNASYIDSICTLYDATAAWEIWRAGALYDGPYFFALGSTVDFAGAESGDSIVICLDMTDYPDFDYCPPNDTTFCWWFTVALDAPVAWIIEPVEIDGDSGITSACTCQTIIIGILDADGIDTMTIQLDVEGTIYTIFDLELVWDGDSILTFTPAAPCWTDGQIVDYELLVADNIFGTPLAETLPGSFIADYSPPELVLSSPFDGAIIPGPWGELIYGIFEDIPSGLNYGIDPSFEILDDGFLALGGFGTWVGDTLFLPGSDTLSLDGEIEVCIYGLFDSPDYCDNTLDTCFSFTVVTGEPAVEWLSPIDLNLDFRTISACSCQTVIFGITTSYGLYPDSTIIWINSVEYLYDPAWMTFTDDHDSLIIDPAVIGCWSHGETAIVELHDLVDSTGGHLVSTVIDSFIIDLEGPVFTGLTPIGIVSAGSVEANAYPVDDYCLDIMPDSIVAYIGGSDVASVYGSTDLSITDLSDGDLVTVCAYAHDDCADYCGPNYSDTCWSFEVMVGEPAVDWIEPIDLNLDSDTVSACSCQVIIFDITTTYGIFPESTVVQVSGVPYTWDPLWMTLAADHSSLTLDPLPICPHTDGELVTASVVEMVDSTGGHLVEIESGRFTVDLDGPHFMGAFPTAIYSSSDVSVRINASDDICDDLVADSIVISIGGSPVATAYDTLGVAYSGLADGDHVTVCAFAHDNCADYCGPNYSDTCWSFDVTLGAVTAVNYFPLDTDGDGMIVSGCQCPPIQWLIFSDYDIVPDSTTIVLEGIPYSWATGLLVADAAFDTLTWNVDSLICFTDSQVVHHSLIRVFDVTDESLLVPILDSFLIDISPPTLVDCWPYPVTFEIDPIFGFVVFDTVYSTDYDDFLVTFGIPARVDSFDISSSYAEWSGDTLIIDYTTYPETFAWGDSVRVCLYIHDNVDVCEPNYLDTCWIVVIQDTIPPYADSWVWSSGCDDQAVPWLVYDDMVGVDTTRFDVTIDGLGWSLTDLEVFFAEPETLYYQPSALWTEGWHTGCVVGLWDWATNPIDSAYCYDFLIDLTPPEIVFLSPECSTDVYDTLAQIVFTISDSLSPLNPDSCWIVVRGDTFWFDSLTTYGDTIVFDPAAFGWIWVEDETVTYCVHASDMPTYCSNTDERCCEFYVVQSELWAEVLEPPFGIVTSCSLQTVEWLFHGDWDPPSAIVVLDDTATFTSHSGEISHVDNSLFFTPVESWANGQTVQLCVVDAEDTFGVHLADTVCAEFTVDLEPPIFADIDPPPGTEVAETSPVISLTIIDLIAGLDPASVVITIDGNPVEPSWFGDTLVFDTADSSWIWTGGDTIRVCVWAADLAQICGPNADSLCWEFYIASGGPLITPIEPPADSLWSACADQGAAFTILDPDGVDSATIIVTVGGDAVTDWTFLLDTLVYTPPVDWVNADSITVCVWAVDSLGNPPDDWVCITYFIDLEPPVIVDATPNIGGSVPASPVLSVECADSGSGIDAASIIVSLNGVVYTPGDGFLTWDGSELLLDPDTTFAQGDTLFFCFDTIADSPDICPPNVLDSCWFYIVEVLPDVWTDDSLVSTIPTSIVEGDTILFEARGFMDFADFELEINWDIVANGIEIYDDVAVMTDGDSLVFIREFSQELNNLAVGDYTLCLRLDYTETWHEWNEDNNIGCTNLTIISSECDAHPNPFSPNGDGVNDLAIFTYPGQSALDATIKIFDMEGRSVCELANTVNWDGDDDADNPMPRGIYMYLVIRDNDVICKGTIYLVR